MKGLNEILLQIVLLFGVLVFNTEILCGQSLTPNNCTGIHYTENQDKRCLECLINTTKKDSLIQNYALEIFNYREITVKQNLIILDLDFGLNNEREKSSNLELKLGRSRRNLKIGIGVGFVSGVIGSVYFLK